MRADVHAVCAHACRCACHVCSCAQVCMPCVLVRAEMHGCKGGGGGTRTRATAAAAAHAMLLRPRPCTADGLAGLMRARGQGPGASQAGPSTPGAGGGAVTAQGLLDTLGAVVQAYPVWQVRVVLFFFLCTLAQSLGLKPTAQGCGQGRGQGTCFLLAACFNLDVVFSTLLAPARASLSARRLWRRTRALPCTSCTPWAPRRGRSRWRSCWSALWMWRRLPRPGRRWAGRGG